MIVEYLIIFLSFSVLGGISASTLFTPSIQSARNAVTIYSTAAEVDFEKPLPPTSIWGQTCPIEAHSC
jgi:hypothetical protein